jgi:uncharacterized membrane protein
MDALDKLDIQGWDRVRVWIEHNMAVVLLVALVVALIIFAVLNWLQKKSAVKTCGILNANAIEMAETSKHYVEETTKACEDYMDRADERCRESEARAAEAAERAEAAMEAMARDREALTRELERSTKVQASLMETINFLMQCSDLSQTKRDEANMIFEKGLEAMKGDESEEA